MKMKTVAKGNRLVVPNVANAKSTATRIAAAFRSDIIFQAPVTNSAFASRLE